MCSLMAMTPKKWHKRIGLERIDIVVDSGSSASMLPTKVAPNHELLPGNGKTYTSAAKTPVQEIGTKNLTIGLQDGSTLRSTWEVGDVHRPLASVSKMTAVGNTVIFAPENDGGSWMIDSKGNYVKLHLRGGVYVLPAWISAPNEEDPWSTSAQVFPRQG